MSASIVVGFIAAFVSALLVVTQLYSTTSPATAYAPFAWWRIVVGAAGLAGLLVYG